MVQRKSVTLTCPGPRPWKGLRPWYKALGFLPFASQPPGDSQWPQTQAQGGGPCLHTSSLELYHVCKKVHTAGAHIIFTTQSTWCDSALGSTHTWGHLGPGPSQAEVPSPPRKGLSYNNPESPFTGSVVTGPPLLLIGHLLTPVLSPGTYLLPKSVVRKCPNVLPPRLLPPPAATLRACSASVLSLRQNAEFPTHMGISVGRAGEPWWNSASSGKCRTSGGQQRGAGAGGGEPSWELGSSSPEVTRSHP